METAISLFTAFSLEEKGWKSNICNCPNSERALEKKDGAKPTSLRIPGAAMSSTETLEWNRVCSHIPRRRINLLTYSKNTYEAPTMVSARHCSRYVNTTMNKTKKLLSGTDILLNRKQSTNNN